MHFPLRSVLQLSVAALSALILGAASLPGRPVYQTPYVTRAEAVMLLLQARIPKIPSLAVSREFIDVPKGAWYERYIAVAERLKIIQVNPVTRRIRPEDPVTRAEFLSMATRAFGINTALFSPSYEDVAREAWYAPAAGMAQRLSMFPADPNQAVLRPDTFMIHTEVAKAVQILIEVTADAGKWAKITTNTDEKISTSTQNIAIVKPRGSTPRPSERTSMPIRTGIDPSQIPRLRTDLLVLINAARTKAGLRPLQENGALRGSAQKYAQSMVQSDFFGHVSPAGETLRERMEESGYYKPFFQLKCLCVAHYLLGENLARGQKTPREAIDDWLESPTHRAAIMNPAFTDTGIGISAGIWVQHFGGRQN